MVLFTVLSARYERGSELNIRSFRLEEAQRNQMPRTDAEASKPGVED